MYDPRLGVFDTASAVNVPSGAKYELTLTVVFARLHDSKLFEYGSRLVEGAPFQDFAVLDMSVHSTNPLVTMLGECVNDIVLSLY
jgi:hypothetical protein